MSERGPRKQQLNEIAQEAERDLNTYQSKTGTGKGLVTGLQDYGVNDTAERKLPGVTVKVGKNPRDEQELRPPDSHRRGR